MRWYPKEWDNIPTPERLTVEKSEIVNGNWIIVTSEPLKCFDLASEERRFLAPRLKSE